MSAAKRRLAALWRASMVKLWDDPRFRALPVSAKLVWFAIRLGPKSTSLPGVSRGVTPASIAEDAGVSLNTAKKAIAEIVASGLGLWDPVTRIFYAPMGLEESPPRSADNVLGWRDQLLELPPCAITDRVRSDFDTHCRTRGPEFSAKLAEALGLSPDHTPPLPPPQGPARGDPETKTKTKDQERDQDQDQAPATGSVVAPRAKVIGPIDEAVVTSTITTALAKWDHSSRINNLGAMVRACCQKHRARLEMREECTPLEPAVELAMKATARSIDRGKAQGVGVLPSIFAECLDPALFADLERTIDPDAALLRRTQLDAHRATEQRRRDRQSADEERARQHAEKDARYQAQHHAGESRAHFELRYQLESHRREWEKNGSDPRAFVAKRMEDLKASLVELEATETSHMEVAHAG